MPSTKRVSGSCTLGHIMSESLQFNNGQMRMENVGQFSLERPETVLVGFASEQGDRTLVQNARVKIYQDPQSDGTVVPLPVKTNVPLYGVDCPGCYFLLPEADLRYKFTFYTTGLTPGLYNIQFTGLLNPLIGDITETGQFIIGYVSAMQGMVDILRDALYDFNPNLYQLMSANRVWSDTNLLHFLQLSMSQINSVPTPTEFTIATFPFPGLAISLAKSHALTSRAVLEVFNQMQYSDVLSLSIQRPEALKSLAADERTMALKMIADWKSWESLYGDTGAGPGIGFGESKIPFQISRVLSFLPNMKNTFGV